MATSDLQDRRDERPDGLPGNTDAGHSASIEITSVLQHITSLISDADRRQGEALRELHARLETLGQEARLVRTQVPEAYVPAFERIEDGLTQIADRISRSESERHVIRQANLDLPIAPERTMQAATHEQASVQAPADEPHHAASFDNESDVLQAPLADEHASPAPLRSALPAVGSLRGTLRSDAARVAPSGIDPFDLVDSTRPGDADDPWDHESAEALTQVYENLSGGNPHNKPRLASTQDSQAELHFAGIPIEATIAHQAAEPVTQQSPAAAAVLAAPVFDIGRDWLEARFAEIASRVEQSLSELRTQTPAVSLDSRFEQFEHRFGLVLEGVATRSDLENLREFETQLDDLALHVEQAQLQLQRLDTIEAQLNAVMEKLSDQRLSQILEQNAPSNVDAERIAQAAAEKVAQRFASIAPAASASDGDARRLDELRELLGTFMTERRQGEEQTASMLDTMQQAMIRLLDRVDSLEFTQPATLEHQLEPEHSDYAPAPAATTMPAEATLATLLPAARGEPEAKPATEPTLALPQRKPEEARPQPRSNDVMRDQLIAEARRAMQLAAAKREADAQIEAEAKGKGKADAFSERGGIGYASAASTGGIGKSTKRIMVGACSLLLLSSAVLLLMPRKPAVSSPDAKASQVKPADKIAERAQAPAVAKAEMPPASIETPVQPGVREQQKAAEAAPRAEDSKKPRAQAIPPGFLPQSIPETGIDELANPIDPNKDRNVIHDAAATGAPFPGITLHRNGDNSLQEAARNKEQQRRAEITTQFGAARSATPQQPGALPIAYAPSEGQTNGQAARTGETPQNAHTAPIEILPLAIGPNSLRQAAAKGDPSAEFEVAARFAEGRGIQQNFQQAVRWYQRSASQGFAPAQYRLGTLFERGLGVKADAARSRVWYQRAAEQGHVKAMHNLAVLSAGRDSGSPDYATAGRWFKDAAERGLADSQYNLAVLHESGLGMPKDLKQAYKWFSIAGRAGDKEALKRLDALRAKLTTAEIAVGELLVAAFVAQPVDRLVNDALMAGEAWKARAQTEAAG